MSLNLIQRYSLLSIIFLVFTLAYFIQSHLLLNTDVSWLLEASHRMLSGGNYTKDFFENNPPWVLYLSAPAILMGKIFPISLITSLRIYVFLLAAISLRICYPLLLKLFSNQDINIAKLLLVILALLFIVLPVPDFGQRENLLFIFSMPYLLMMTLRLQNQSINPNLAMLIGILAGAGFMLKPFFLITFFLIELYYLLNKKNLLVIFRPETFTISLLALTYAAIILLRHPDYLTFVLPFALRWTHLGSKKWLIVINNLITLFCYLSILFCLATYEINRYKIFTKVLFIAFVGFFFSYVIQHEDWAYHLLPAYYTVILIYALLFSIYVTTPNKKFYIVTLVIFFNVLISLFLFSVIHVIDYYLLENPFFFLSLTAGIFITILNLISQKLRFNSAIFVRAFFLSVFIGYASYLATTQLINWSGIQTIITGFILITSFSLLMPGSSKDKTNYLLTTLLGLLIFLVPFYQTLVTYKTHQQTKLEYTKLINYMNQYAGNKSVYIFSTNSSNIYPILTYTNNTRSASRFSFFWALPGLIKQSYLPMNESLQAQLIKDKNLMINMIAEDLTSKKPAFVFIDTLERKRSLFWINDNKIINIPFEYLNYFEENTKFKQAWKKYHYLTSIAEYTDHKINPLKYQLQLVNNIPKNNEILYGNLYLYANHDELEIALQNEYEEIKTIKMQANKNGLDKSLFLAMKQTLSTPGAQLSKKNKEAILEWLSKQSLSYPLYKFNIYERTI